jgi:UTP--glucose-1-phosphate uridylyltransferase
MKALIPAAGRGTRFLPATRAVPKEMLPIGAKPALEVIVDEARAAGATEIVIVISEEKELIRTYFKESRDVSFVCQREQKGLGHAVLQAAGRLAGEREPFLVLLGDAVVTGGTPAAELAAVSAARGGASVIGLEEVPLERVSRYGIVSGTALDERVLKLDDLVEKPSPDAAPSRLAIAGRYLLDPAVFNLLATQKPGFGGEIQLTDAIRRLLDEKPVYGYRYPGRRHDIGTPSGYFETLKAFTSC